MKETSWLEDFDETCQALIEDALLLEALSLYLADGGKAACFPQAFCRLSDYLSQHALDLHNLEKRLDSNP